MEIYEKCPLTHTELDDNFCSNFDGRIDTNVVTKLIQENVYEGFL